MNRNRDAFIICVSNILLIIFVITGIIFLMQFLECFPAARHLPDMEQYPVMHILIYGSSDVDGSDTVSARLSFLDTDGTDFAVIERSWKGSSLSMDFVSAGFSGKTIWFPYRIYGSQQQDGTKLEPYVMENGECLLFGGTVTASDRRNLYKLGRYAFGQAKRIFTNFTALRTIDLSGCVSGAYYTVYTGFDGRLFLAAD